MRCDVFFQTKRQRRLLTTIKAPRFFFFVFCFLLSPHVTFWAVVPRFNCCAEHSLLFFFFFLLMSLLIPAHRPIGFGYACHFSASKMFSYNPHFLLVFCFFVVLFCIFVIFFIYKIQTQRRK